GSTVRLPPRMRLARAEQKRLWKGLERFVNCGDDPDNYQDLGLAFPRFWPVGIWHYPNQTASASVMLPDRVFSPLAVEPEPEPNEEQLLQKIEHEGQTEELGWHLECRELFLFYRDSLRRVWLDGPSSSRHTTENSNSYQWTIGDVHDFLLGLTD